MHSDPLLSFLRDARLANHAFATTPVWLWAADATRVLWANAAGAAVLGAANPHALGERQHRPDRLVCCDEDCRHAVGERDT